MVLSAAVWCEVWNCNLSFDSSSSQVKPIKTSRGGREWTMEQANLVDGDGANILWSFEICTNTPNNLDKYILEFAQYTCRSEQIPFASLNKCPVLNQLQCYNLTSAGFDSEKDYFSRQTHSASFTACTVVHTVQLKRKFDCSDCFCPVADLTKWLWMDPQDNAFLNFE